MPTQAGVVRTITALYDLFSDFNPYTPRQSDIRDAIATIGTRARLDTSQANGDNGRQLDHAFGFVRCDATGGSYAMNLPDAPSMQGLHLWLKKIDASANTCTLNTINGQTTDPSGATSVVLTSQNQVIRLYSDGNNWESV